VSRRVLVVDDDEAILEVLAMRLEAMGFEVTATGDPARALDAVDADGCELALFDLRMTPIDGIALMEAVHGRRPRLPVLIMTAHGTIETAVEAIRRGAFDYLTKPFQSEELRTKITRALSSRRWARDRERLRAVGETLASSGIMTRVLESVAQAAAETTEAERCVVFQLDGGQLVRVATVGAPTPSWAALESAAARAIEQGAPTIATGREARVVVAAPMGALRGPAGALVIEAPPGVAPDDHDLELLALFSSQAAVAIRNTHELERHRSGALAALGRMATQVAHELRNPLAGLRLYARHLEHRLARADDGEGVDLTRKITSTIDHLASVVAGITAFGRPPELQRAPTAVNALLDECVALARARCPAGTVQVERAHDPRCPVGLLDARELRQALLNLILNGLEAMESGGRLTVRTLWSAEAGAVDILIEDTGTGMSAETLARAYDLFFTTKPEGTGLGMAIARSVVDRHGGQISIQSATGEGTRVRVRLPLPLQEGHAA
jgi:signal transduction histidine kinase